MKILRAADHRRMPWKNGGGETTEIAVYPQAAGLDDFAWRVSMARIDAGGPFSSFPGVDRSLSILEGNGILLSVQGRISIGLTVRSEPLTFPADVPTKAALIGGPVTDLNVMTRRGVREHRVSRFDVVKTAQLAPTSATTLLLCASGAVKLSNGGAEESLEPYDAALLPAGERALRVVSERSAALFVIELFETA